MHGDDGHQGEAGDGEGHGGKGNAEDQVPEDGIMVTAEDLKDLLYLSVSFWAPMPVTR